MRMGTITLRRRTLLTGMILLASSWGGVTDAASISVWGTGLANDGQLLSAGTVDPHYSIIQAPSSFSTPIAPEVTSDNPTGVAWADNTTTSQWINPSGRGTDGLQPGYYYYEPELFTTPRLSPYMHNIAGD